MAKLRFGILGAGGIARAHAQALRNLADVAELVAVADVVPEAAASFGDRFGCEAYGGEDAIERLLARRDIDAVSLATPSGLHSEQAVRALAAGKHVLTEKPLAITLEQADAMIEAQRKSGKALGCVFQGRYEPATLIVKRAIDEGRFGRIVHADAYLKWYRDQDYYDRGGWRGTWRMDGGGALMNQSVHKVDLLQYLAGPVAAVKAYTGTLMHRIETEDAAVAAVRFRNGALGTIEGMTNAVPNAYTRVEIYGTEGSAHIVDDKLTHYYTRSEAPAPREGERPVTNIAPEKLAAFAAEHPDWKTGHLAVFADFVRAIDRGEDAPVNGPEARKAVEIILAVYRSAREGGEVVLGA
jgi:UDP-N-acetyl-2-amino-2-deoxyglucuronate dehydrogenase